MSWSPPVRLPNADVLYFTDVDLDAAAAMIVEAQQGDFPQIEHEGLIVAIESARSLSGETFEVLRRRAAQTRVRTLPIYVRHLA